MTATATMSCVSFSKSECKIDANIHNFRSSQHGEMHIHKELSSKNSYWSLMKNQTSGEYLDLFEMRDLLFKEQEEIKKKQIEKFGNKGGRKIQKEKTLRECVILLQDQHTENDVKNAAKTLEKMFGIKCISYAIHEDEGKDLEHINRHAHLIFFTMNEGQQMWRLEKTKKKFQQMQTEIAKILGMKRGESQEDRNQKVADILNENIEKVRQKEDEKTADWYKRINNIAEEKDIKNFDAKIFLKGRRHRNRQEQAEFAKLEEHNKELKNDNNKLNITLKKNVKEISDKALGLAKNLLTQNEQLKNIVADIKDEYLDHIANKIVNNLPNQYNYLYDYIINNKKINNDDFIDKTLLTIKNINKFIDYNNVNNIKKNSLNFAYTSDIPTVSNLKISTEIPTIYSLQEINNEYRKHDLLQMQQCNDCENTAQYAVRMPDGAPHDIRQHEQQPGAWLYRMQSVSTKTENSDKELIKTLTKENADLKNSLLNLQSEYKTLKENFVNYVNKTKEKVFNLFKQFFVNDKPADNEEPLEIIDEITSILSEENNQQISKNIVNNSKENSKHI